jgi:hypothetical protein
MIPAATTLFAVLFLIFSRHGISGKAGFLRHREWMIRAFRRFAWYRHDTSTVGVLFAARRLSPHEFFGTAFWLGSLCWRRQRGSTIRARSTSRRLNRPMVCRSALIDPKRQYAGQSRRAMLDFTKYFTIGGQALFLFVRVFLHQSNSQEPRPAGASDAIGQRVQITLAAAFSLCKIVVRGVE